MPESALYNPPGTGNITGDFIKTGVQLQIVMADVLLVVNSLYPKHGRVWA